MKKQPTAPTTDRMDLQQLIAEVKAVNERAEEVLERFGVTISNLNNVLDKAQRVAGSSAKVRP